ncbi:hypothetical protein B0J12DRAFT_416347 [Macrophomina phaseolina]|uniref:Secreted protein n=1 Tax=Macrophomina phaseolina TaxID=35725 RepID=A0ABQ8FSB0_9PEZI|nr:hypothetical protein B0J12DRAFT_416347 [Macrophomina phaseolina]
MSLSIWIESWLVGRAVSSFSFSVSAFRIAGSSSILQRELIAFVAFSSFAKGENGSRDERRYRCTIYMYGNFLLQTSIGHDIFFLLTFFSAVSHRAMAMGLLLLTLASR